MDLKLNRIEYREDGIFSELLDPNGNVIAHTLEHAFEHDGEYSPVIPDGVYTCVRGVHRLHDMTEDFITFEIAGITGHTNLLFHWGNFNKDSEGCILVGKQEVTSMGHQMVTQSREEFQDFMRLQVGLDSFILTVC